MQWRLAWERGRLTEPERAKAHEKATTDFQALHRKYYAAVHGVLMARLPVSDVDDVAQEVFVAAFSRLGDLRDIERFGPWILQIARNKATDALRKPRLVVEPFEEGQLPGAASTSDRAEASEVLRAILALPESYRETLVLRLVEGMNAPEIAKATGLTAGSVRVNIHRGLTLLRERLQIKAKEERYE